MAFAADTGIASVLPIVKRLLSEDRSNRVLVFCGAQGEAHAEPMEDLLALKDRHLDQLSLSFVMNREPEEAELLTGRLDASKVGALASKLFDPKAVREFYICGSRQLVEAVSTALKSVGVEPAHIHHSGAVLSGGGTPTTAAGSAEAADSAAAERGTLAAPGAGETRVEFVMDGRRRAFTMHTDSESILDAAARAGIDLPFSCKAGVCSTCRTKLVRGQVEMVQNYALEDREIEQGFILACQSHAKTPEIELTYDEK